MKRFAGALLIAGLLFVFTYHCENKMENSCRELSAALDECAEYIKAESYDEAISLLEKLDEKWVRNELIMGIVSGDDNFRVAGKDIKTVNSCIEDGNFKSALLIIREIQSCFAEAVEWRKVSIDNIL